MKTKNTVIFLITILFLFLQKLSSQTNILYFMDNIPTRSELNPGFVPTQKVYVHIASGVYLGLMTNSFAPNDFIKSINGEMKTAFDTNGGDGQAFLKALKPENYMNADVKIDVLGFGFKVKKNYFSLNIAEHLKASASAPYDLPWLLINGLPQTSETKNLNFASLGLDMSSYLESALGYSREILPNLTAGAKIKFLSGMLHGNMSFSALNLNGNYSSSALTGKGTIQVYTPFVIPADNNGRPAFDSIKPQPTDFLKFIGSGMAFDVGAAYKPLENLTISFSITDLGSITWKNNVWTADLQPQTKFKNVSFQLSGQYTNGTVQDSLERAFSTSNKQVKTVSKLTSHTRVGVEYGILKNKISFGVLYDYRKSAYYSESLFTGIVNFRPFYAINAAVGYSQINAKTGSLNAALNFNFGPTTLFFAGDYIPFSFVDKYVPKINHFNLKLGGALTFGRVKKTANKKKEKTEEELIEEKKTDDKNTEEKQPEKTEENKTRQSTNEITN